MSFLRHIDTLYDIDLSKSEAIFSQLADCTGIHKLSYIAVNLPAATDRHYVLRTNFPSDWAQRYEQNGYFSVDPVVRRSFHSIMPFDWAELKSLTATQANFFGESREFGVGERGISIPLRTRGNEQAMLSLTSNLSHHSWQQLKREELGRMRLLASVFHASVMSSVQGVETPPEPMLTYREVECLRWCAEGKTHEEIASILRLSPRTVRFFLDSARRKMNCQNIVQTVVVAMQRGWL